ncbi:hypothetical protein GCM10022198_19230 [Klugiella xanthotipulae]
MRGGTRRLTANKMEHPLRASEPHGLPVVVAKFQDADHAVVILNGEPLNDARVHRSALGAAITDAVSSLARPTRVEIHESDGSRHVDILTPPRPPSACAPTRTSEPPRTPTSLIDLVGDGFAPGEHVAVCLVMKHVPATHDGLVHTTIGKDEQLRMAGELAFVGRVSGRVSIQTLP